MGKNEIVKQLAERIYGNVNEKNIRKCTEFCDTLADIFTDALLDDKKITWKGFLSVKVIERAERQGRHPQTNEVVTFPPVKSINCRLSESIKDAINGR